ncbi:DNA repair protein RecN [Deinococcus sp. SDU3-2]|uniref:DNA repair protein RecN n=1 Tax=Deinococcus terrestris TaxID=2651870 RepID=A0A7X1TQE3_9DEIO|nr:DNA repair protein RecN [Deinococcus terrestris]MPY65698.1 DNA repair protein RecN [Deinococcus terrestris]
MTRKARTPQVAPVPAAREASTVSSHPTLPLLSRLEVRHLATIRDLSLELRPGFSAFTGETGAGKSIIVDALGLLLGTRANADLIRTGEESLLVSGFWEEGGDEFSASRRVTAGGRGTARLDGEPVSVRELGEWSGQRLTIHWQHSAVTLLSPARQRALLDRQVPGEAAAYAGAYRAWTEARARLEALRAGERERARQLDLLAFQVREITEVSPQPGEEEPLTAELTRLSNLETIAQGAAGALELLSEGETTAAGLIAEAVKALNAGAKYDEASGQLQHDLREALDAVQAVVGELRGVAEDSAPDPEELARVEGRLSALGKLRAKYGPTLEDVLAFHAEAETDLNRLTRDEQDAGSLEAEVERLHAQAVREGEALDRARREVAGPLAARLVAVIRELGMPHARLEFRLSPLAAPGPSGLSDVALAFTANPGEDLGPLADVASGGELSRVMLAISTVLGADTPTVVFDEVDAGIGGAAALAVAGQLAGLAGGRQVLVVTHLAQIAARADHHYKVEKRVENGRTVSHVRLLTKDERLEEIARMLSGNTSEVALSHAHELLSHG